MWISIAILTHIVGKVNVIDAHAHVTGVSQYARYNVLARAVHPPNGIPSMTTQVRNILESFDMLPETDKRELAAEILRRSQMFDALPLTDEQLVGAAEETFLELDRREAENA
jgi:hypothetical protein